MARGEWGLGGVEVGVKQRLCEPGGVGRDSSAGDFCFAMFWGFVKAELFGFWVCFPVGWGLRLEILEHKEF